MLDSRILSNPLAIHARIRVGGFLFGSGAIFVVPDLQAQVKADVLAHEWALRCSRLVAALGDDQLPAFDKARRAHSKKKDTRLPALFVGTHTQPPL
jgi:hypothetical protein